MKIKNFKMPTWFIEEELCHKISISYDGESKRAYDLLDILFSKYCKIDRRRKVNSVVVTEEEYQTWYKYFLEYYIDDSSIYAGSKQYKESKKLLNKMFKFFGVSSFSEDHRAGSKLKFAMSLVKAGVTADKISQTEH